MFSLKLCCVLAMLIAFTNAGLTTEQMEAMQAIMNDCKAKTEATDDDLATIMRHEIPESVSGLCFAACVKKTMGILKDDNTLDIIKIEELLTPLKDKESDKYDNIMKMANACASNGASEADECQASKSIMHCFMDLVEANHLKMDFMSMLS